MELVDQTHLGSNSINSAWPYFSAVSAAVQIQRITTSLSCFTAQTATSKQFYIMFVS